MPLNPSTLKVEAVNQELVVKLTAHELDMLTWLAARAGLRPAELLADFIADLSCSWRTGGSDEREYAFNWYKRCGYSDDYIKATQSTDWRAELGAESEEDEELEDGGEWDEDESESAEQDTNPGQFYNVFTGATVTPSVWQTQLKIGDYYYIAGDPTGMQGTPPIYGQIESNEGCQAGFFWARGYSIWCPEGEIGLVCICDSHRQLSAEEFEAARKCGWRDQA